MKTLFRAALFGLFFYSVTPAPAQVTIDFSEPAVLGTCLQPRLSSFPSLFTVAGGRLTPPPDYGAGGNEILLYGGEFENRVDSAVVVSVDFMAKAASGNHTMVQLALYDPFTPSRMLSLALNASGVLNLTYPPLVNQRTNNLDIRPGTVYRLTLRYVMHNDTVTGGGQSLELLMKIEAVAPSTQGILRDENWACIDTTAQPNGFQVGVGAGQIPGAEWLDNLTISGTQVCTLTPTRPKQPKNAPPRFVDFDMMGRSRSDMMLRKRVQ